MIYLLLAILSMSAFMLTLKFFSVKGIGTAQAVIVNYILASAISVFSYGGSHSMDAIFSNSWWYLALISGALFFASMHLMSASTRIAGVSVTTIASRTALILPIVFSFLFLGEPISLEQAIGVGLVIVAMVIIFYGKNNQGGASAAVRILMPLGVFLVMGAIAICMKSSQHVIARSGNFDTDYPLFESLNFIAALLCAIIYYGATEGKEVFKPNWKSMVGGLVLGGCNFGVTYAILHGLLALPTSVFYASYNISVVVLTAIVGWLVFGEKLSGRKIAGITLALCAIAVLMLLA